MQVRVIRRVFLGYNVSVVSSLYWAMMAAVVSNTSKIEPFNISYGIM